MNFFFKKKIIKIKFKNIRNKNDKNIYIDIYNYIITLLMGLKLSFFKS